MTRIGEQRAATRRDLERDIETAIQAAAGRKIRNEPGVASVLHENASLIGAAVLETLRRHWTVRRKLR